MLAAVGKAVFGDTGLPPLDENADLEKVLEEYREAFGIAEGELGMRVVDDSESE